MNNKIEELIKSGRIHKETAKKIQHLKKCDQKALFPLIEELALGINFCREFTDYLYDLSKISNKSIASIIKAEEIQSILHNPKLPLSRKIKLIKNLFFKMRYPIMADYKEGKEISFTQDISPGSSKVKPKTKKIIIGKQKGTWLKRCPGTPEHICCNYLVINNGMGCAFDCTYCYLQTYMNQSDFKSSIILYNNIDNLTEELKNFFEKEQKESFRIGTGEFTDSLALDQKVGLSKNLIELFAEQNMHLLELKTKSNNIDHLLNLEHKNKTIFSWSLNPEKLIKSDEKNTVSLKQRLEAARKATKAGYKVGFHFDPLIHIKNWQEEYEKVVNQIFKYVKEDNIAWVSLGALRFNPKLKNIVGERFPESTIMLGEFVRGQDGKMRYFEPIRTKLFQQMILYLRSHSKKVFLYLCMESPEVWKQIKLENPAKHGYAKYFKFKKQNAYPLSSIKTPSGSLVK